MRKEHIGHDLDDVAATLAHRDILLKKPFLKKLYEEWYGGFLKRLKEAPEGDTVEIGSGGGFLKDMAPFVITSDIQDIPHCDKTFAAEELPFAPGTLNGIFMLNVLHHIPNVDAFLEKARETLKRDGIIYMVEPATTLWSRWVYTRLHHEPFDPSAKTWTFPSSGPMSGANGALPWIIFNRDRKLFEEKYPTLTIERISLSTPFRYLMSGGFSYKSLVPHSTFRLFTLAEALGKPLFPWLAMFQMIVIRKNA
ncbi:MAG: methyltransferase domain-containing protein [Flavobacteriales bacterium]|nr:methyltransferase domain-containing protein [Flavobacteriales bacterium]